MVLIFFKPDGQIFPSTRYDAKLIADRLESKAYLHGGLTIEFAARAGGRGPWGSPASDFGGYVTFPGLS